MAREYLTTVSENLTKLRVTTLCPNCLVPIQKNGGCSKVVCFKCRYDFCWHCLFEYKQYRHDKELEHYHPIAIMVRIIMAVLCIVVTCVKVFAPIMPWMGIRLFNILYALVATGLIDFWVFISIVLFAETF